MGVAFDPETQTMRETCHREVSYVSSAGDTTHITGWTDSSPNHNPDERHPSPCPQKRDTNETAPALSTHEVVENEEVQDGELREDSPLRSYLRGLGRFAGSVEEYVALFGTYNT